MTVWLSATQLTENMYEKVAASDPDNFDVFWSKTTATIRRKASCEYFKLWAIAAVAGTRQALEDEVFLHAPSKQRIADSAAVAGSRQQAEATDGVEESHATDGV